MPKFVTNLPLISGTLNSGFVEYHMAAHLKIITIFNFFCSFICKLEDSVNMMSNRCCTNPRPRLDGPGQFLHWGKVRQRTSYHHVHVLNKKGHQGLFPGEPFR